MDEHSYLESPTSYLAVDHEVVKARERCVTDVTSTPGSLVGVANCPKTPGRRCSNSFSSAATLADSLVGLVGGSHFSETRLEGLTLREVASVAFSADAKANAAAYAL